MIVAYARTSTLDQEAGLNAQLRDLEAVGAERVFSEQVSSVADDRPQLRAALEFVRDGDVLVVTKLDRLARSTHDLLGIVKDLERQGVTLRILAMNLDTGTATGRLLLTMVAAIATFEREIMLERQREGVAAAKAAGKYKGRVPTARRQAAAILARFANGESKASIARSLGVGERSVYRIVSEAKGERE